MKRFFIIVCLMAYTTLATATVEPLRVAVAGNFYRPLKQLISIYQQENATTIHASPASTGKHYLQILHGAPFDIFLAADQIRPQRLEAEKRIVANSRKTYATGQLAFWQIMPNNDNQNFQQTLASYDGKIAIANPKIAPYGLAAQQFFQSIGQWEKIQQQIVRGNDIVQTYQYVQSEYAKIGVVALSQIKLQPNISGTHRLIDADLYQPILQDMVLIHRPTLHPNAKDFYQFILSPKAQSIIKEYGYLSASIEPSDVGR